MHAAWKQSSGSDPGGYLLVDEHGESSPRSRDGARMRISGTVSTLALRLHSQHTTQPYSLRLNYCILFNSL